MNFENKMNFHPMSVLSYKGLNKVTSYLKICISPPWLLEMGFIPGALVQAVPEPGGMAFHLCDENIRRYSELYNDTKRKNGALVTAASSAESGIRIDVSGASVSHAGFAAGDSLLARYEYGLVKVRKLPVNTRFIPACFDKDTQKIKLKLIGKWFVDLGFKTSAVVIASATHNAVTFKRYEGDAGDYPALVKQARANRQKILRVSRRGYETYAPCIEVGYTFLEQAGLVEGDNFLAVCEQGYIQVSRLDFERL